MSLEQSRHEHQRGESHEDVHDVGRGAGAEDLGDDVRVEQGEDGPVQATDDEQCDPERIEPLEEIHHASFIDATAFVRNCT